MVQPQNNYNGQSCEDPGMTFDSPNKTGQEIGTGEAEPLTAVGNKFAADVFDNRQNGSHPKTATDVQSNLGFPFAQQIASNEPVIVRPGGHGHTIQGPDFLGTDPGNYYVARGSMREPAIIFAHDGASVYAGDGAQVTADGGSIFAMGSASVRSLGNAKIFYRGSPSISAGGNTEVYRCTGGDQYFVGASCQRER
jgi:hypothetical protein